MKHSKIYLIFVILSVAFSCKHKEPEYPLKVTVLLDGTKSPCPNATVTLGGANQPLVTEVLSTGPLGTITYTYKLPAIINATARYTSDSITFYEGSVVIRLKEIRSY